jgi:hypothetical protein
MSKYIVVVLNDEQSAYKGALALQELDNDASIALYEGRSWPKTQKVKSACSTRKKRARLVP